MLLDHGEAIELVHSPAVLFPAQSLKEDGHAGLLDILAKYPGAQVAPVAMVADPTAVRVRRTVIRVVQKGAGPGLEHAGEFEQIVANDQLVEGDHGVP